jgi:hypothetical protein
MHHTYAEPPLQDSRPVLLVSYFQGKQHDYDLALRDPIRRFLNCELYLLP